MKTHTITAWMLLSLACLQLSTCRAADELVGRQVELLKVLQATPAWTKAFTASSLTEAARAAGDALATISEPDWDAYLEWVRTDPAPAASLSGQVVVERLDALDPGKYGGKQRKGNEKALYRKLLPLIGTWRAILDGGDGASANSKRMAAWSDEQLSSYLAETFDRGGVTVAKLKHDQWMFESKPGRRVFPWLLVAMPPP